MENEKTTKNYKTACQPDNAQIAELKDRMMGFRKKNLLNRTELARLMGVSAGALAMFEKQNIVGVKTLREFLRVESEYRLRRGKLVRVVDNDGEMERGPICRSAV